MMCNGLERVASLRTAGRATVHPQAVRGRGQRVMPTRRRSALVIAAAAALTGIFLVTPPTEAETAPLAMCGNTGPAPAIKHVIVVMLENESYSDIVGNDTAAPYMNNTLTAQCGYA